jgi:hydroxyethylthiazole kinase-like uncharacterized protein yjeF
MIQAPKRLFSVARIRQIEQAVMENNHVSGEELMQRAGQTALEVVSNFFAETTSVIIFCGGGNNGGDGYVLAKLAHEASIAVTVVALKPVDELPPIAKKAAKACEELGIAIESFVDDGRHLEIADYDLIVDAILGIGLQQEVTGAARSAIELINQVCPDVPVLSLDVPSGVDADTGEVLGDAVEADLVLTFIAGKPGLFTGDAVNYCRQVLCGDLGLEDWLTQYDCQAECMHYASLAETFLLPRRAGAHKGYFGHVLIVGGDLGMPGAAILAGEACLRSGAGLVTVATQPQHVPAVVARAPELMARGVTQATDLIPLIDKADVIAVGPGLSDSEWSQDLFYALTYIDKPLIVDAGALTLLERQPQHNPHWILTPHPGEAARLMNTTVDEVQGDRFGAVEQLQQQYGGIVILKGAGTLIKSEDLVTQVCMSSMPSLATAGTGDVLTGVVASLVAQRFPTMIAAMLGVLVHTEAGRLAGQEGERGTRATDLMDGLRQAVNPLQLTRAKQKEEALHYLLTERVLGEENIDFDLDELNFGVEDDDESYH